MACLGTGGPADMQTVTAAAGLPDTTGAAGENASAPEQAKSRAAIEAADLHCEMLAQASRLQPSPGSVYRPLRPTACRRLAVKQPVAYKCSPVRSSTATRRV